MGDKTATTIRESLTTFFWQKKQQEGFKQNDNVVYSWQRNIGK